MNNYWWTADTHYLHKNILKWETRPYQTIEEMTEDYIAKWNSVVKKGDTCHHLGDFAMKNGAAAKIDIDKILSRLNGNKILITGNHDHKPVKKNPRWHTVTPYMEVKVDLGGEHKQRICMFHYAARVWNQSHRGAWFLHGHSHDSLKPDVGGKILDVGVDSCGPAPVGVDQIRAWMDMRPVTFVDHHTAEAE